MFKLTKYEFRKIRNFLIVMAAIFVLLEAYFLISSVCKNIDHMLLSSVFLSFYGIISFFVVYFFAITNYYRELNSKSSYLIFMTPNSSLNIIFSKLLSVLIVGITAMAILILFAFLDVKVISHLFPEQMDQFHFSINMLKGFGINVTGAILGAITTFVDFLIGFFSEITLIYLAITLSMTLLQNRKFKGLVSFLLFLLLSFAIGSVYDLIPQLYTEPANITEAILTSLPGMFFNLIVMIGCIFGCSKLLDKTVSFSLQII